MAATKRSSSLRVLYCSSEVAPFSQTGRLSAVSANLPKALSKLGHDVRVVTPLYGVIDVERFGLRQLVSDLDVHLGGRGMRLAIWEGRLPDSQVPVYFVDSPPHFKREGLYQENGVDHRDNADRFALFSGAVLEVAAVAKFSPQIIHCNDWQTALVPVYMKTLRREAFAASGVRSLLTIHNLAYQGLSRGDELPRTGLGWDIFTMAGLEFYGSVNLLKGGIVFADATTTVSPTYCREMQMPEYGFGLDGVLRARAEDLAGILDGIGCDEWDPERDAQIAATFSAAALKGKATCKTALQRDCGLHAKEVPVLGIIVPAAPQRNLELLSAVVPELVIMDVQVVIAASEAQADAALRRLAAEFPDKVALRDHCDAAFAHCLIAGADILLDGPRYEPCGMYQMAAMRYGTVPVVRHTGGLADTVVDYTPTTVATRSATGFHFEGHEPSTMLKSVLLALEVLASKTRWRELQRTAARADFSWQKTAEEYADLYARLVAKQPVGS